MRTLKGEIGLKHPPYPPSKEGGISLTIPLSKGGQRGIVPKVEGEKMCIENNFPRPIGTPPSTEGRISLTIPLSKGGRRGIVPIIFPLVKGDKGGLSFSP